MCNLIFIVLVELQKRDYTAQRWDAVVLLYHQKETLALHSGLWSVVVNKLLLFTLCVPQQNALRVPLRAAKHVGCILFLTQKHLQSQLLSIFYTVHCFQVSLSIPTWGRMCVHQMHYRNKVD